MRYCYFISEQSGTFCAVAVSLWYFTAAFAVLPLLQMVRRLKRRPLQFSVRTLFAATLAIAVVLGVWQASQSAAVRDVLEAADREFRKYGSELAKCDPLDQSLESDCHYLGNASSPLPFIVAYDWSWCDRSGGAGGRGYFLWFFGLTLPLTHWDYVTSQRV
jgi:hypothetical protein